MKRKVALAKLSLVLSRLLTEGGFIFVEANYECRSALVDWCLESQAATVLVGGLYG
jgi:hypothetical protein